MAQIHAPESEIVFNAAQSFAHIIRYGRQVSLQRFAAKIKAYTFAPEAHDLALKLDSEPGRIWRDGTGWHVQLQ